MGPHCLVCGRDDYDAAKLHYFPRNLRRSKVWQEHMEMVFSGEDLRNFRICSVHFTDDCYSNLKTRQLRRDAIPTLLPCSFTPLHQSCNTGTSVLANTLKNEKHEDNNLKFIKKESAVEDTLNEINNSSSCEHATFEENKISVPIKIECFSDNDNTHDSTIAKENYSFNELSTKKNCDEENVPIIEDYQEIEIRCPRIIDYFNDTKVQNYKKKIK